MSSSLPRVRTIKLIISSDDQSVGSWREGLAGFQIASRIRLQFRFTCNIALIFLLVFFLLLQPSVV